MKKEEREAILPPQTPLEANKLFFDGMKHVTTLDSAILVVLATVLTKMPLQPEARFALTVCGGSLLLSLTACLAGMFTVGTLLEQRKGRTAVQMLIAIGFIGFIYAMVFLGVFAQNVLAVSGVR